MTPITVMMMVTGVCQGFFSFISESGGGCTDRQTGREVQRVASMEDGETLKLEQGGGVSQSCIQMWVMSQHVGVCWRLPGVLNCFVTKDCRWLFDIASDPTPDLWGDLLFQHGYNWKDTPPKCSANAERLIRLLWKNIKGAYSLTTVGLQSKKCFCWGCLDLLR